MPNPISSTTLGIFGVRSTPALGARIASGRATPIEMAVLRGALQAEAVPDAQLLRAVRQLENATTPAQQTRAAQRIKRLLLHASRELVLAQVRFRLGVDRWEPRNTPLEETLRDLLIVPPSNREEQVGLQSMAATVGEGAQCRRDGTYLHAIGIHGASSTGGTSGPAQGQNQQLDQEGLILLLGPKARRFDQLRKDNPSWIPCFRGANLRWAYLVGVDLHGVDLSGADLHGTDLRMANLSGAKLHGASLNWADLSGADLSDVTGLTVEQLGLAISLREVIVSSEAERQLVEKAIVLRAKADKALIKIK